VSLPTMTQHVGPGPGYRLAEGSLLATPSSLTAAVVRAGRGGRHALYYNVCGVGRDDSGDRSPNDALRFLFSLPLLRR